MDCVRQSILALALAVPLLVQAATTTPVFFPDDPIEVMPPPALLNRVLIHKLDQPYDFIKNSLRWQPELPVLAAGAVNTLGHPPDSAWFTNRHGSHRMTREELQRGPAATPPVKPFTIIGGKSEGITPGFRMKDATGRTFFVKVDPMSNPEMGTASDVIVSRFLYAIGYNVPENYVVRVQLADLKVSSDARVTSENGFSRKMTWDDVLEMTEAIPHYSDKSFRLMASLKIPGESIGPFYYEGTRADDPNDIVLHENRRDLRGLSVFFSWLNNTDARAGNTYDAIVEEGGKKYIKHYLLDFGSALGSDGDSPKDARLGHAFMIATPLEGLRSMLTLGLIPRPWERLHYPALPAVGNFTSEGFDPEQWKSDYPNQAFLSRLPEDEFWAAEQVTAFTADDIRAIVETGEFSDPFVVDYLTNALADRRDSIGRAFFAKVLPLDNFRVENGELHFDDLAAVHEYRQPQRYDVRWYWFDNMTGARTRMSGESSTHLPAEAVEAATGAYFSAAIHAANDPLKSITVTIRKTTDGYRVVGCSRT
ncbi:MAG TPA: hypothetical protein VKY31_03045 [Terriglobia bacterium]|nr:hypothetical protein [Terriglobia bacterium]